MRYVDHPNALPALAIVSFVEGSFFPIPPDALMIPMILASPKRAFRIASVCLIASVLGGFMGYLIGAFFFENIGRSLLQMFVQPSHVEELVDGFNQNGGWIVLFAAVTPIPYKAVAILSGATGLSLDIFIFSSIVGRGARFFLVASLLWKFGDPIREFIERWLGLLSITLIILILLAIQLLS